MRGVLPLNHKLDIREVAGYQMEKEVNSGDWQAGSGRHCFQKAATGEGPGIGTRTSVVWGRPDDPNAVLAPY